MNTVPTFVEANMPNGCEGVSVRIAGIYLRLMLEGELSERVLSGTINKLAWKKLYLSFMRKNGVDIAINRHAFQVLYALSRHYNVCRVDKTSITWTSNTAMAAHANLTIGELRGELSWAYTELRRLEQELNAKEETPDVDDAEIVRPQKRMRRELIDEEEGECDVEGDVSNMTRNELRGELAGAYTKLCRLEELNDVEGDMSKMTLSELEV